MKVRELMIGNLVFVDNEKNHPQLKHKPMLVCSFDRNNKSISIEHVNQHPNTYYQDYSQFIEFIKPIPLTEDRLKEFGFICISNSDIEFWGVMLENDESFTIRKVGEKWIESIGSEYDWGIEFDSVNWLQNQFYYSTGQELTMKES